MAVRRGVKIEVRATVEERDRLRAAARRGRKTVSDLVRDQLGALLSGDGTTPAARTGSDRGLGPDRAAEAASGSESASVRPLPEALTICRHWARGDLSIGQINRALARGRVSWDGPDLIVEGRRYSPG